MSLFGTRIFSRRRTSNRPHPPADAPTASTVPPSSPEAQELEAELETYRQQWRDAANTGARFRIEEREPFRGYQYGEPYLYVRLVEDDAAEGQPFEAIAHHLYFAGAGCILSRDNWEEDKAGNLDCLWLRYGAIADYRLSGALLAREPATEGWGGPADLNRIRFEPPDFDTLLPYQCYVLGQAAQQIGMKDPRVVIVVDHHGTKSIVFNLHTYFSDTNVVLNASGILNNFLPKHYHQAIFFNDYEGAVYPLLPFEDRDRDELMEVLRYAEFVEEQKRTIGRLAEQLAEEVVPTPGTQRWHQIIQHPDTRFDVRLDEIITDGQGFPYTPCRLAEPGGDGYTFREAALAIADHCGGALLCGSDWSRDTVLSHEEADEAQLTLPLGDLVYFLMTGNVQRMPRMWDGWLYPTEYYTGRFSEPSVHLLPWQSRRAIRSFLEHRGITDPRVALQSLDDGRRLLHFSGFDAVGRNAEAQAQLVTELRWCLPHHYTVFLLDSSEYLRWSLYPNKDTPADDFIDLEDEEGNGDD